MNDSVEASLHSIRVLDIVLANTEEGILKAAEGFESAVRSITCVGGNCVAEPSLDVNV
jgi:hypothetical protein